MPDLGRSPPAGVLELILPLAPVSQQARTDVKDAFKQAVLEISRTAQYLFSGDVQLSVEWLISERTRYETDRAPDVDNILKPLIDSFVGPDGLLIDDNQVQHVSCSWIDWNNESEQLRVELRFSPDDWIPKQGLVFVKFGNGLCLPIPNWGNREQKLRLLETYSSLLKARGEANQQGLPYTWSQILMPKQRVFHRTRLNGFNVLSEEEFRAVIAKEH